MLQIPEFFLYDLSKQCWKQAMNMLFLSCLCQTSFLRLKALNYIDLHWVPHGSPEAAPIL